MIMNNGTSTTNQFVIMIYKLLFYLSERNEIRGIILLCFAIMLV